MKIAAVLSEASLTEISVKENSKLLMQDAQCLRWRTIIVTSHLQVKTYFKWLNNLAIIARILENFTVSVHKFFVSNKTTSIFQLFNHYYEVK